MPVANPQWWLDDFGFEALPLDGSGVTIAVIDTGIDGQHPNLAGAVKAGTDYSGVGDQAGSPVGSSSFHGTAVASIIAGRGAGPDDILGIAPGVSLLSASIGLGVAGADTDRQLADAVVWAVDNGADIINLSLTRNSAKWPVSWDEAFLYAFENDVLIVAATGNAEQGSFATAPAVIPGVIAVTAIDQAGSTEADAGSEGIGVSVAAPGVEIMASVPDSGTGVFSGSSVAAPIVSGLLALMIEADPQASANDLIQRLLESATDLGEPGFDASYGFGVINPIAAVESRAVASVNPLGSLANWVRLYRPEVSEDAAEIVVPQQPLEAPRLVSEPPSQAEQPINPLLYLLLVPIAFLPLLFVRKFFGRR
jgi:subtilisin family serine protease